MSYAAAIEQLNAMTPELVTRPGQPRRKFSLNEVRVVLEALGNPQARFKAVLIAGTNGKGSTAATLASILSASGLRTGLYTSPHLERVNERVRIDGALIPDDDFARHYFRVHDAGEALVASGRLPQHPSFFETLTALAFAYFAEQAVEIAVLEVGMGGRLDATNVVDPLLSVITDISLDHTEWLGPTIAAITREKAGILRAHGTLVTLPQHPEANQALGEAATELEVRGVSATPYMPALHADPAEPYVVEVLGEEIEVASPLKGEHQHRNVALAIAAAVELKETQGFAITPGSIGAGIRGTRWPGRMETLRTGPDAGGAGAFGPGETEWILDVAHNPAGAWALRAGLSRMLRLNEPGAAGAVLVFGCLRDKPLMEMAQILFPLFERVVFAPVASVRAVSMDELMAAAAATGTAATAAGSVAEALRVAAGAAAEVSARSTAAGGVAVEAARGGRKAATVPVVVSGSVYLVGEARTELLGRETGA